MRGVLRPRPRQHCPPDSGFAASCCHFFFYSLPPRARARPRGSFVERRTRSCQSIRAKINQKGTIGRTWASLFLSPPPTTNIRPCADARFSSIKILNSAIPLWQCPLLGPEQSGGRRGTKKRGGGREEGGGGNEGANGHVPTMGI